VTGLVARRIASEVGRCEGPVIRLDGEIVVTSMSHGKLYKIVDGKTQVLADVGHSPNGATEGSDGIIYVAQAGGKRWGPGAGIGGIQAVARDGSWRWVTQDPIAPNDLCFGPDGWLYCTDPTKSPLYFTDPTKRRDALRDDGRIFRCDVETGEARLLGSVPWYPNGIGFGPDNALYVANYSAQDPSIVRFSVEGDRLSKGELYVKMAIGHRPDGFLFDVGGNIVIGANSDGEPPGEIQTYDRNGRLIDTFVPGSEKKYTNVALGSDRVLIVTDTDGQAVLGVDGWPYAGLPLYPFRKRAAAEEAGRS
jgi:gluconolactonase